jgi:hypothetical protein
MSVPIVKRLVTVASMVLLIVVVSAFVGGRGTAFSALNRRASPTPPEVGSRPGATRPVQTVAFGQRLGAAPGQKGATYYALEGQTARLSTRFADGTRALSERSIDGSVTASLADGDGNELHRLRIDRFDEATRVLSFRPSTGNPLLVQLGGDVHATLDWTNRQGHTLHQDGVSAETKMEWNGGLIRRAGVTPGGDDDGDRHVRQIETQWANGLSATTVRARVKSGDRFAGRRVDGDVLTTKIVRDGVQVGLANYFVNQRIYAWKLDGASEGWIADEHLQARHGGWPFTPDMVWMNLQTLALYQWKTAIDRKGFIARSGGCPSPSPAIGERVAAFFAPAVHANEPGCDGLHWLDGTIYRYCCDVHDMCYAKSGCGSSSWWQWWSSWTCDVCNASAAWCFATGGVGGILYPCVC